MEQEKSLDMTSLVKKLHEVQLKLRIPKDLKNDFGKYKYRNAEGILEALKEVMPEDCITFASVRVENGVEIMTEMFTDGITNITASVALPPYESKKGMSIEQVLGSRISYCRKYVLGMLYAIDDSKDDPDSKEGIVSTPVPIIPAKPAFSKWDRAKIQ